MDYITLHLLSWTMAGRYAHCEPTRRLFLHVLHIGCLRLWARQVLKIVVRRGGGAIPAMTGQNMLLGVTRAAFRSPARARSLRCGWLRARRSPVAARAFSSSVSPSASSAALKRSKCQSHTHGARAREHQGNSMANRASRSTHSAAWEEWRTSDAVQRNVVWEHDTCCKSAEVVGSK
ncbi:hypothetical protein BC828DRAFT_21452 [Blastocladiella britannica]|nr:hypothetical protein BC828DRAFT_21452 [Blastocladiella britannica]